MESLYLTANKITSIIEGTFKGATKLKIIALGNNLITSVAAGAFADLAALGYPPEKFAELMSSTNFEDPYFRAGELSAHS